MVGYVVWEAEKKGEPTYRSMVKDDVDNVYRRKSTRYCTAHYIPHKALYKVVLEDIKRNALIAKEYEGELSEYAKKLANGNESGRFKRMQKELDKLKQRDHELDTIITKLFEQNALGVISDERFVSMSTGYEAEQKEAKARILELQEQLQQRNADGNNTTKFLNAVRKYSEITELNPSVGTGL